MKIRKFIIYLFYIALYILYQNLSIAELLLDHPSSVLIVTL